MTAAHSPNTFVHRHAAHCESGVMSNLLRHYGLDVSEPMAFGLSSAMLFAHFPFVKVEGFPLTAYRAAPGTIIKALQKSLGVRMKKERFRRPAAGTQRLDQHVRDSRAVGLQASVFWLPYFPPDMRFHFNAHNLVVYGKQGDEYLVSDPVAEHTVTCNARDLEKARFVKGLFAPKGLIYYPTFVPERVDLEPAVRKAIRKTAFQMLKIPAPYLGVSGIRLLSRKIQQLHDKQVDPRYARLYVSFIVRMQEEIGTGGGGFRFVYASFLQEAGQALGNSDLQQACELMTTAGDAWREFALMGARFCKKKGDIHLQQLAQAVSVCADKENEAFRYLQGVRI
jgi:hypothetical protein